jgi:hypothetical protein
MSDAHVAWTVVGAVCEVGGLWLLYMVIRRRQREADLQGSVRSALTKARVAWERARDEIKRTIENPAPPVTRPAELRGTSAATSLASGEISVRSVANETALEAIQRRVRGLERMLAVQGTELVEMRTVLQQQLSVTERELTMVQEQFHEEMTRRDREHKKREATATRLEVLGSGLFLIGVGANVVANLT